MKNILLFLAFFVGILVGVGNWAHAENIHVTFLNPGSAKDIGVWRLVSNFMQAAADDLNITLEVLYADRNHIKMMNLAEEVANRTKAPDYVIMVNEKLAGKKTLLSFKNSSSKIFFIHNSLTRKQRNDIGDERVTIKNWIGTIVTDEYQAGYKLIQSLYRHAQIPPKVLGITGTKSTPVSLIRLKGVEDFILESARGEHIQIVYGKWSYEEGKEKALALLKRYKDINIIWAANDSMALGAYDAAQLVAPERNILIGGLGGFPDALASIKKGGMKVTVGGHVMIGAWALVLIYDYHFGLDFIHDIGAYSKVDHITVIDNALKADRYADIVLNNPQQIDFHLFSKKLNPDLQKYDFSFDKVIKACEPSSE
jgi:ABC-type sugar transport system substrate-binding protein